jgi:hypothetical protein
MESQTLVDENGIEILVGYESETSDSQIEEGHGEHEVGCLVCVELKSVEVIIAGRGIDILPMLNERQKDAIVSKISHE